MDKLFLNLEKYNLKIQLVKSEFLKKPNSERIAAIQNWPLTKNEKELKVFLGTFFIGLFSDLQGFTENS